MSARSNAGTMEAIAVPGWIWCCCVPLYSLPAALPWRSLDLGPSLGHEQYQESNWPLESWKRPYKLLSGCKTRSHRCECPMGTMFESSLERNSWALSSRGKACRCRNCLQHCNGDQFLCFLGSTGSQTPAKLPLQRVTCNRVMCRLNSGLLWIRPCQCAWREVQSRSMSARALLRPVRLSSSVADISTSGARAATKLPVEKNEKPNWSMKNANIL